MKAETKHLIRVKILLVAVIMVFAIVGLVSDARAIRTDVPTSGQVQLQLTGVDAAGAARLSGFVGEWMNQNPQTSGVTRVRIRIIGGTIAIYVWGKCHPTDCDWAQMVGAPARTPVSDAADGTLAVTWIFSFAAENQRLTLLPDGRLRVATHTHYTDNSGRSDFTLVEYFHLLRPQSAATKAFSFVIQNRAVNSGQLEKAVVTASCARTSRGIGLEITIRPLTAEFRFESYGFLVGGFTIHALIPDLIQWIVAPRSSNTFPVFVYVGREVPVLRFLVKQSFDGVDFQKPFPLTWMPFVTHGDRYTVTVTFPGCQQSGAPPPPPTTAPSPPSPPPQQGQRLRWPFSGSRGTRPHEWCSPNGWAGAPCRGNGNIEGEGDHKGIDFHAQDWNRHPARGENGETADKGQPLFSATSGTVIYSDFTGNPRPCRSGHDNYGRQIIVAFGKGFAIRYTHLQAVSKKAGEDVAAGEKIGEIGDTGLCTGIRGHTSHLHVAVYESIDTSLAACTGTRPLRSYLQQGGTGPHWSSSSCKAFAAAFEFVP